MRKVIRFIFLERAFRFNSRGVLQVKGKGCTEMFHVELCEDIPATENRFSGSEIAG